MCEGESYCKTRQEITDWLSGKYIVLLHNQVRFKTDDFGTERLVREARIIYIPVSS